MTRVKVSEASGAALDWMVAKAANRLGKCLRDEFRPGASIIDIDFDEDDELAVYVPGRRRDPYTHWRPSTDWAQGGPIIEREKIGTGQLLDQTEWVAGRTLQLTGSERQYGPTPLVAAMRCFVASKLGDEVDVPEGLL